MFTTSNHGLLCLTFLRSRLLLMLATCLLLPIALVGGTGKAAPTAQTPSPTPNPNPTPSKPILLTDPVPDPHQDGVLYLAQTGHTLRGTFLSYWQQYGGLAQFGYPLTEEFFEPSGPDNSPLQVQYFERNRFELHPENQPLYDIELGTLSREFRAQDPPAPQQPAPALYFPQTGHNLSGKFLEYWQSHGGLRVHGFPITEPQMERSTNGKEYEVQWFERSRFELHPENAGSAYEVLLGLEGRQLSEKKGYPFGWYPEFGHAVDFSWVSGKLQEYIPVNCTVTNCGCSVFHYEENKTLQLDERKASALVYKKLYDGAVIVIFGRLAYPGESFRQCPLSPTSPGYWILGAQSNPQS